MRNLKKYCFLFIFLELFSFCLYAEKINIGKWTIILDTSTGTWKSLFFQNEFLIGNSSVQLQWLSKKTPIKLKKWDVNQQEKNLTLQYQAGDWVLHEIVSFDVFKMSGLMRRSYSLSYHPEDQSKRAQFGHINTTWMVPKENCYWRPGAVLKDGRTWDKVSSDLYPAAWFRKSNDVQGVLKDLAPGYYAAAFNSNVVAVQTPRNTVMLFLQDIRRDPVDVAIEKQTWGGCFVQQTIRTGGWAYRSMAQKNISNLYLAVVPHSKWLEALRSVMPKWYHNLKWTVPGDRPAWVYGASVYELESRFGADQSLERVGRLVSRAAEEGFDTFHIQPVQEGPNVYNPENYFNIDPHCGTAKDFQRLVNAAHKLQMKVWLDIVPHGGFPEQVFARNTPVSWLTFTRDGHLSHPYPCDYKNPDYQNYIGSVADYYMKRFKIDGFRIDQPYGSPANWSTENFPPSGKLPPSPYNTLSSEYWNKSLAELGGKMPHLSYERGSLCESEGGIEMVRRIRDEVKKNNPNGTIHSETLTTVFPQVADVVYDLNGWLKKIIQLEPNEFVPYLSRFLEEQKYLFPPRTLFLRIFQNHDRLNPFPSLGTDMGRAVFAVNTLSFGNPIILQYGDTGHSVFLRKLNAIRHSRKELQSGDAEYLAVKSSIPAVWTVLRRQNGACSIGVVNFSSKKSNTNLVFDPVAAGLCRGEVYTLKNLWTQQDILCGTAENLSSFDLELNPFEIAIISAEKGESSASTPPRKRTTKTVSSNSDSLIENPEVRQDERFISVITKNYSFIVNRKTGLPRFFGTPKGASIRDWDIMTARLYPCVLKDIRIFHRDNDLVIDSQIQVGEAVVKFSFRCFAEGVRVECFGDYQALKTLAIILPLKQVKKWKLNAFDGILEDPFWETEFQNQLVDVNYGRNYRNKTKMLMIWDQLSQMLNPADARIDFVDDIGGLSFSLDSALKAQPANIVLLKRLGDSETPALQISLRDYNPITADASEHISFFLKVFRKKSHLAQQRKIELGEVSLENNSAWYTVENNHYKVTLDRLSGSICKLIDKRSSRVILENQLTGGYGLVRPKSTGNAETVWLNSSFTRFDVDATSRIWIDGDVLRMRFLAQPHGSRSTHSYPENKLWTLTEYAFDRNRTFSCTVNAFSETGHFWDDFLHEWTAFIPETMSGIKKGTMIAVSDVKEKKYLAGAIESTDLSEGIGLEGERIRIPVFTKNYPFIPRQYVSRTLRFSVAGEPGVAPITTDVSLFARALPETNSMFEQNMKMALLLQRKSVTYPVPDVPGIWISVKRGHVCYDLGASSDSLVALRLEKNVTVEIPLRDKLLHPGKYLLTFSMKGKFQKKNQPYLVTLGGADEKTGNISHVSKMWQPPVGDSDWHTQTISFCVKKKSFAPFVQFLLLNKYERTAGVLWINNVQIIPDSADKSKGEGK